MAANKSTKKNTKTKALAGLNRLKKVLRDLEKAAVAFSGGTDSTLLLKICLEVLGREKVTALTAVSPLVSQKERENVKNLAETLNLKYHLIREAPDLEGFAFKENPRDRCYYCKKEIYAKLLEGFGSSMPSLLDGTNLEDLADYRPGRKAAEELGVRFPFVEAGLDKEAVRCLSKKMGLPNWDKPAEACLASRIPYGEEINAPKLLQIEKGEEYIKKLGFGECRLRHHGPLGRIEVPTKKITPFLEKREAIHNHLKDLGFTYITLDLQGLHRGSMNRLIKTPPEPPGQHW